MKLFKAFLAAALAISAGSASAQTGIYVLAGIGQGKASFEEADFTSEDPEFSRSTDTSSTTWNIGVGWRFHRNIAVEAGYADLGKYTVTFTGSGPFAGEVSKEDYKVTAVKLAAVGLLPIGAGFTAYGKLGYAVTNAKNDFTFTVNGVQVEGDSRDKSKGGLYWGLGAQYDIVHGLGVRLEYENFGTVGASFDDDGPGRAKISTFNLNLIYQF